MDITQHQKIYTNIYTQQKRIQAQSSKQIMQTKGRKKTTIRKVHTMKQLWCLLRTSFFQARHSIPFSCLDKLILLIDCFCYGVYCDGDFKEFFQSFVIKLYSFTIKLVMDSLGRYKDPETLDTALILSTPCTVALWSVNLGQTTTEELWFQLQFFASHTPWNSTR